MNIFVISGNLPHTLPVSSGFGVLTQENFLGNFNCRELSTEELQDQRASGLKMPSLEESLAGTV